VLAERVRRLIGGEPNPSRGQSALLVAVPETEALVRQLHGSGASRDGLPPHVTVLFPFLSPESLEPDVLDTLREIFQGHDAFAFSLTGVDTFPGVVWLVPEPGSPFLGLTRSVTQVWPELVPYGDPALDPVAHLTVGRGRLRRRWRALIGAAVPIEARATEVLLMTEEAPRSWAVRARFPLGGS
jgi:2'-5' RNA ligase